MPPYALYQPDSPSVEFGIKDQAQIFNLGTQHESGPAYARKVEGRNLVFPSEINRMVLEL